MLAERFAGDHPARPKIPVHSAQAILNLWARGRIDGAAAQTAVAAVSKDGVGTGVGLDATEVLEAQDIIALVTSIAAPTGTQALQVAQRAEGLALRAQKIAELDQTLLLLDSHVPPFTSGAAWRTFHALPTR